MKIESCIFDQERLLGVDWLADVRLVIDDQQRFDALRNRCADMFGEVAPRTRDADWMMSNDRWAWAVAAYHDKCTWGRVHRLGFAIERATYDIFYRVIILRHRSMLAELGIKERKEWIKK